MILFTLKTWLAGANDGWLIAFCWAVGLHCAFGAGFDIAEGLTSTWLDWADLAWDLVTRLLSDRAANALEAAEGFLICLDRSSIGLLIVDLKVDFGGGILPISLMAEPWNAPSLKGGFFEAFCASKRASFWAFHFKSLSRRVSGKS